MGIELLISLTGLALIDSTSIGTLLIPIWLLLDHRQVRASSMMIYLLTIAGFYLLMGLAIMFGADLLASAENPAPSNEALPTNSITALLLLIAQLAIGIVLFVISFRFDSSKPSATSRVERWKQKAADATTSVRFLMGLALFAALAEVATMLPYLGAIALIATAQLPWHLVFILMFAYCLMMILPAMVLLVLRMLLGERIRPILITVDSWITKNAASALGWVLGIAGFLIASDALTRLWIV
ncbi:hypothetical protein E3V39_11220 [Gammaproteobacteria bacterium LSUCC0112]|nr:hypothetical protein E3V39_11220 [Gammaproteobacteria bacterium LSUCC0112]